MSGATFSRVMFALLVAGLGVLLFAHDAFAVADGATQSFSCSNGKAQGQLYSSGTNCPTTLDINNVFSFLVCNMEQLSSNLMGHMYCGMIKELTPAVWTAATLAVVIFGVGFTIGVIPATGRDALMFLLKLTFITGFATNSDLLIGVAYNFFVSGISDGVTVVLSGIGGPDGKSGNDVFKLIDGFLLQIFHYATDSMAITTNYAERCKNAIFAVMATMAVAFPIFTYLGLLLLGRMALTFFRAVFGYLYALVGITFLLVLAPFFVTFAFFKQTKPFFDKWIGYLGSFTIQMVLLFAFLGFILSIPASNLTKNLGGIIMYQAETVEGTAIRMPWEYCTLCDFKVVDKDNPGTEMKENDPKLIEKGMMVCKDNPKKAISMTFAIAPKQNAPELNSLLLLAGNGLLSLIVLAFMVERLLAILPSLAQKLASGLGVAYAPQLGGGANPNVRAIMHMPGDTMIRDFNAGFNRGFSEVAYRSKGSNNGISSSIQGVKDGLSTMITGKRSGGEVMPGTGVGDTFKRWFADPNRFSE